MTVHTVRAALADFRDANPPGGWADLPFFHDGRADGVAARVDTEIAAGTAITPSPENVFNALTLTPLAQTRVVILGQDPYPTPGDAHGLAFSYVGARRLPASLKVIFTEMAENCACIMPRTGDLSHWARQGVLLLNTALTTQAGRSGAHLRIGWDALTDEVIGALARQERGIVFMLWGARAIARAEQVAAHAGDTGHLVLTSGHPSPLNRKRDFRGNRHFAIANDWLHAGGQAPIDWCLHD
ncbi:MAG: uracil-DNA glycosylase Udg [Saliniramus fredricksonii]|uniref:Uracil-DNA glycosylase n=1 Tax=Saliniramus fredricksonii TaxID=1653334 RepID=A0A0P7Y5Z7_9HYPH|nr:uracil-DNA glycosylase [Saliniramus fredricksonii]KPQ12820.1 MAG: uracil-DNA glycosylase Udg [Saliniramus fredricksonii]SCC82505.1 Uracil-DNA glycosylase [Saliniramus fredricksonii]